MKKSILLSLFVLFSINFIFSQNDINTAINYFNDAKNNTANKKYELAIENYKKAAKIFKKNDATENYIIAKVSLNSLLINLGKIDEAKPDLKQLLPEAEKELGIENKLVAHIYTLIGRCEFMASKLKEAEKYFITAYNLNKKIFGYESVETANCMNDLALIYANSGIVDSAIFYYNENIRIITDKKGENHPSLSLPYINLSNLYITLGKYDDAIEMKLKIIDLVSKTKGKISEEVGEAYSGLGSAYMIKGEYSIAEEYMLESINIYKELYGENSYKIATNYINLGNLYNKMGNYDYSLQYFFLATKILEANFKNNPDFPGLYNNIGLVCKNQGNYENAKIYFTKALEEKEKRNSTNDEQTAIILTNLGSIFLQQKDTTNALKHFFKSASIFKNLYGSHSPLLVSPLLNIANLYYERNELDSAKIYLYKSINANQKYKNININSKQIPIENFFNGIQLLEAINSIASIDLYLFKTTENKKHLKNAAKKIKTCDSLITSLRKSYFNKKDKIRLNAQISKVFDNAVKINYLMHNKGIAENNEETIFYYIERNKTSSLLQALNDAKVKDFGNVPDSLLQKENEIKDKINIYNQKMSESSTQNEKNFYREKVIEENQNYNKIINLYKNQYPEYYKAKFNVSPRKISDLKKLIDDSTAVINFYLTENKLFAAIITKEEEKILSSDITSKDLEIIKKFNTSILSNKSEDLKNYLKYGYELYNKIFFFEFKQNIKKLLIIPDDILGNLSFDALITEKYNGDIKNYKKYPYLIKDYLISYSYSATLFYETATKDYKNIERKDILTIAPVFAPGNNQTFNDNKVSTIKGTEIEVLNIDKMFNDKGLTANSLMNKNANEYKLKTLLINNRYNILHIATHGYVNFEKPELSALILSKDPIGIDDGILYSGEIYNINLNCDLITLSACETARGKISKGEGVIGLSRAFMFAGAKNMIISLWRVSDFATTELMTNFYKNLLKNYSEFSYNTKYINALYKAKFHMINSEKYSHPYYWSSFILIGE